MTTTVTAAFCPLSLQTLFDQSGLAISGAKLSFYDAGTTNPRTVYRDAALTLEFPTPLVGDSYGRVPPIFVGLGAYKVVARDASANFLFQVDGLAGATSVSSSSGSSSSTSYWRTGDLKPTYVPDLQDGFVLANGMSIGSAASAATSRANADCQALFIALWNADATLVVSGGRGANATADWNGAKSIALPDWRGYAFAGCDGMGNALAGRLTVMANPDSIGSVTGAETVTLDGTMIAAHSHTITVAAGGGHTPAGTITGDGSHQNTGTVNLGGGHAHTFKISASGASGGPVAGYTSLGASSAVTDNVGDHAHTFTTDTSGTHAHGFGGTPVADHIHTASASSFGGGAAHSNMQPTKLCYVLIKL